MENKFRVLELYSGIGGMHYAFTESSMNSDIVAAIDINTVANKVYKHNFPNTNLINRNIQSLSPQFLNELQPNIILMSPPCQPFTRNGLQKDSEDPRSDSFEHFLNILKEMNTVQYILLENVKGFESSKMRQSFTDTLKNCGFYYNEYLLNPFQFGVPNSRLRYYCLARKKAFPNTNDNDKLFHDLPQNSNAKCFQINDIIEECDTSSYKLPVKHLKRANVLDICYKDSDRSCCFTKAYTHFLEGTGSVFTECSRTEIQLAFEKCYKIDINDEEHVKILQKLNLRFFTPREVLRLMSFPESFSFPVGITNKQKYRLIGNSINVKVVSILIKLLING